MGLFVDSRDERKEGVWSHGRGRSFFAVGGRFSISYPGDGRTDRTDGTEILRTKILAPHR